ncbi:MAG: hypothetical protein WC694_01495 [Candidatus Paceibacterota bacterium]|jgi:hypothetical protein
MKDKSENKICQNCEKDFVIEPDDFGFYEKIKVPLPTFCTDCRRQRRWAWRNKMSLFNRKCDLCGKGVVSIYAPDSGLTIYCNKCWWSDKWDAKSYGSDYDFSKTFFSQFRELIRKVPHMSVVNDDGIASLNCEYTHDWWFSKNCYMCFSGWHAENAMYCFFSLAGKDIVDCMNLRSKNEFLYECIRCATSYCHSSKHLFGCCAIKHGQYCILNKEYSKEEYFKLRDKLIEHMKKTGEYGEFFPASMSNFGYNETMAMEYFPLSKEEAKKGGYKWWDKIQKTINKETLKSEHIPDSILDISENILNEVLTCVECGRNYKIIQNEFTFYKKYSIPIPRKCFFCRNSDRLKLENSLKLWHRKCMNIGCQNEFETSYAPNRPEIVYCEKCYQQEVY